jgi:hypothetical protein
VPAKSPKKLERTHFAHDERVTLGVQHLAGDLGMKTSNASAAVSYHFICE